MKASVSQNPKFETRNPKEVRKAKPEIRAARRALTELFRSDRILTGLLIFSLLAAFTATGQTSRVIGWGSNEFGQSIPPAGLSNAVSVAAIYRNSYAVRANGTVTGWGNSPIDPPVVPAGLNQVVAFSCRGGRNLALRSNGTVVAWSFFEPDLSQRVPTGLSNVIAIAEEGSYSLALKANGTVVSWNNRTNVPPGLSNVIAIAAAGNVSLAAKSDGTVAAWDRNGLLLSSFVPPGLSNVAAVAASHIEYCMALKSDGTVVTWGRSVGGVGPVPAGLSNVVAIDAHSLNAMALKSDGTVVAWGSNDDGQNNVPSRATNVTAISVGWAHMLAVTRSAPAPWPRITQQPQSVRAFADDTVVLRVTATSTTPLRYRWQFRGQDLANETNDTLVLSPARLQDSGDYAAIVSADGLLVRSAPAFVSVSKPPVAQLQTVSGLEDTEIVITVTGFDPNGLPLTAKVAALPGAGRLFQYTPQGRGDLIGSASAVVADLEGRIIYLPNPNAHGQPLDTFLVQVSNEIGDSAPAKVNVHIAPVNDPPVALVQVFSPSLLSATNENHFEFVAPNNATAIVILDASLSSDVEGEALSYQWFVEGESVPFATGTRVTNVIAAGTHRLLLQVWDDADAGMALIELEVLTPAEATEALIRRIEEEAIVRRKKLLLLLNLRSAVISFESGNVVCGLQQLRAFQKKVRTQVMPKSPDLARDLDQSAQQLINALAGIPASVAR